MSTIDENGLVIDRYDEVKAEFDADLKTTFGEGTKTDARSVFGQISAITSERVSDQNELIEIVANLYNPNGAPGVFLSQLLVLAGLTRNEPVYSTVAVDVTANSAGSNIAVGSTVSDPAIGEPFALDAAVVLAPLETKTVSATAVNQGAVAAPAGTLTKIDNATYGWESVTNSSDASVGALEESDIDARIRRTIKVSSSGSLGAGAMLSEIRDVDGVDLSQVYENKTNAVDARGISPHSTWAVVRGGSDADIAAAIYKKTAAGAGWYGSTTVVYPDPVTGENYNVKFSRSTEVPIYVTYVLQKYSNYPSNGDGLIIENTVKFFNGEFLLNGVVLEPFGLDDDVVASRLYTPANTVPGHKITEVLISTSPDPTASADIAISADQLAGTETAFVKVA